MRVGETKWSLATTEGRRAGLKEGKRRESPAHHPGGNASAASRSTTEAVPGGSSPGCRHGLTSWVGAALQDSRKAHVSQLCPPKISPLQVCETAQFKKMGLAGCLVFFKTPT